MNNAKYSDNFSIMIEKPLSDFDRKTLNNLYLPIVHGKTLNIFYYFSLKKSTLDLKNFQVCCRIIIYL